jgi:D-sedoheptulose 7-phosphate isomerase
MSFLSIKYLDDLIGILKLFPHNKFDDMIESFLYAYENDKNIFVMGNGGSGATASHWAADINKGCCMELNKKFKMICLNDNIPTMLAYANDCSYDDVFVEQLKNFFDTGDIVIGISGSGNSKNVLKAIKYAKKNKGRTIGLCGYQGGKLYDVVDIPLLANVNDMQKVEDIHMIIVHISMKVICDNLGIQACNTL